MSAAGLRSSASTTRANGSRWRTNARAVCAEPNGDLVTDSTREMMRIEAVLVVGSQALIRAVRDSVRKLGRADVVTCEVREAQTRAAELRPFAIVMHDDVYAFDSTEFDALARGKWFSVNVESARRTICGRRTVPMLAVPAST